MQHLIYEIAASQSITKHSCEHNSSFESVNILQQEIKLLSPAVKRFNDRIVEEQWKNEDDIDNMTTTSVSVIDDIVTVDDDIDD